MPVTSALIVEPRNHIALDWVVDNVAETLGAEVPIHLHHGNKNKELSQAIANKYKNVRLHNMKVENLSIGGYSNYMTQSKLYENLPDGHTIVFQTDSAFCDPSAEDTVSRLNKLSEYDYIGAPWKWWTGKNDNRGVGGNGGFSLRNTHTMARLSKVLEEQSTRDDVLCDVEHNDIDSEVITTSCDANGSSNDHPACVLKCHKIAAKMRHPEDVKLTRACKRDQSCKLPNLFEAAEFQNQHEDFTARATDSEIVKEPISGVRCLKTERDDPIGFHKPQKFCHRLQKCPAIEEFPWRKRGTMTNKELREKLDYLKN